MKYIDYNNKEYTGRELIKLAKQKWKECFNTGEYCFILDFPVKRIRSSVASMKFLNNLYADDRETSFWVK